MVLTGTLARSTTLQERWHSECPKVTSQSELDKFLSKNRAFFKKPANGDYSTNTASISKGARGYIGRGIEQSVKISMSAYENSEPFHVVASRLLSAIPNYGEFLNSHFCFQLLHYSRSYKLHGPNDCEIVRYMSEWQLSCPIPAAVVSRKNTMQFFKAMSSHGPEWVPVKRADVPTANVAFKVLNSADAEATHSFASSVLGKLQRLENYGVSFTDTLTLKGTYSHTATLAPHAFRPDNMLVQACMAEKGRRAQAYI